MISTERGNARTQTVDFVWHEAGVAGRAQLQEEGMKHRKLEPPFHGQDSRSHLDSAAEVGRGEFLDLAPARPALPEDSEGTGLVIPNEDGPT